MKNLKIIIIITIMLIFSACLKNNGKNSHIAAVNGYLDLSGQDFKTVSSIRLDGEWEFYWNRLLTPADFSSANPPLKTGNINIPSYWNGYVTTNGILSGEGFATFRLKIKVKQDSRLYALKIRQMFTAYKLWIDNKIIASNGTVGIDRKSMDPQFLPLVAVFQPGSEELQIIIQISNFYHVNGGFWDSISIGYEDAVRHSQIQPIMLEMFIFGVLIIMGIYFIPLYIMKRRDHTFFYFSLICFFIALRIPFVGEHLIHTFLPYLDWEFCEKISYITTASGLVSGNLFLYWLMKEDYSRQIKNIFTILGSTVIIFVVVSFSRYYWHVIYILQAAILLWLMYSVFVIVKASINKREGYAFLIIGIAAVFIASLLEILYQLRFINAGNVSIYGIFIFIITQALMLSYRYSYSFIRVETLSREKANLFASAIQIISSLILQSSTRLYEKTQNVTKISAMIAGKLGYDSETIEEIKIAALLHDIGMIGVHNIIPGFSGNLTEDEKLMIENHPKRSIDLIKDLKEVDKIKNIIEQHHESYDGSGFPAGLSGSRINKGALIIRVADDFFTLLSLPDYQDTGRKEKIISFFKEKKGLAYAPSTVDAFITLINEEKILQEINKEDISASEENGTFIWKMPGAVHLENLMVSCILDKLKEINRIDAGSLSSIEFSLGEVIRNAIVHGNKFDTGKSVTVKLRISDMLVMENKFIKVEISVTDEGEGMDIDVYAHFKQLRTEFATAIRYIKDQRDIISDEERKEAISIAIKNFEQFQLKYFFDFNTFMNKKTSYLSGGVGLIYVLRMFDNVEFRKIIDENRICGMEVIMEKNIPV